MSKEWIKVEKWEDVARFAGRTICYTTKSEYIKGDLNFKINENQYGIISDSVHFWTSDPWGYDFDSGYQLYRICLEKSVISKRGLTNTILKNCKLEIRLVTEQEKSVLIDKLKENECKIEFTRSWKLIK